MNTQDNNDTVPMALKCQSNSSDGVIDNMLKQKESVDKYLDKDVMRKMVRGEIFCEMAVEIAKRPLQMPP